MFQRILVPMDGSKLSESVIPYVKEICQRCDTIEVILLHVVRPPTGHAAATFLPMDSDFPSERMPASESDVETALHPIFREQEIASVRASAEAALTPMSQQLQEDGISAQVAVAFGRPAQEIVEFAEREGMDLIAMCTHGRSGIGRWLLGSTADKVLRGTYLPVLLARPAGVSGAPLPSESEAQT
jgi:nucleotide-binding universal stress UspA family protein